MLVTLNQMSCKLVFQFHRLFVNVPKSLLFREVNSPKMPYYAVARGRTTGIFMSWGDCEAQVKGFSGARYKKFDSIEGAQDFVSTKGSVAAAPKPNYYHNDSNVSGHSGISNHNLKRSYSTSTYNQNKNHSNPQYSKTNYTARDPNVSDSYTQSDDSDDSDDLSTVIAKQLDDIEKRVNKFEKGIDKIIKKNTTSSGRKTILIEPPEPKRRRSISGFEEDNEGYVQVYTDGACSANGRQGARAGIGVFWGDSHHLNTSEPVTGRATNNCGEIQAATCAIKQALQNGVTKLAINTDSQFLINSVTKWMPGWKRKGWKLQSGEPVKNEIDFKELDNLQHQLKIKWNYVEAHRGVHGNEMADQLAKAGAAKYKQMK